MPPVDGILELSGCRSSVDLSPAELPLKSLMGAAVGVSSPKKERPLGTGVASAAFDETASGSELLLLQLPVAQAAAVAMTAAVTNRSAIPAQKNLDPVAPGVGVIDSASEFSPLLWSIGPPYSALSTLSSAKGLTPVSPTGTASPNPRGLPARTPCTADSSGRGDIAMSLP